MELYNVRDPPGRGDQKICRENTIATRTEIVSKSKRTIFNNHSPRTSPWKDFFAQNLSFFAFLLSLINYECCLIHGSLAFKSTLYKFIVLGFLGLNPSTLQAQEPKRCPYKCFTQILIQQKIKKFTKYNLPHGKLIIMQYIMWMTDLQFFFFLRFCFFFLI